MWSQPGPENSNVVESPAMTTAIKEAKAALLGALGENWAKKHAARAKAAGTDPKTYHLQKAKGYWTADAAIASPHYGSEAPAGVKRKLKRLNSLELAHLNAGLKKVHQENSKPELGEADIAKAPGQKEWSRKDRKASMGRIRKALKGALQKQYVKGASSKLVKDD